MTKQPEGAPSTLEALARQQQDLLERVSKLERQLRALERRVGADELAAIDTVAAGD